MSSLNFAKSLDADLPTPSFFINESIKYRDIFLNQLKTEYWRPIDNIPEFFELFRRVFTLMSISPNERVFEKYDEILSETIEYRWNLGANGFVTKIKEINGGGKVYIPLNLSFIYWLKYLDEQISFYCRTELLKIMANLQQFEDKSDPDFLQKLKNGYDAQPLFENYFRRKKYDAENKKEFDLHLDEVIDVAVNSFENFEGYSELSELRSDFMSELKGDTERKFLAEIFKNSILLPGNPEIEKYAIFLTC